MVPTPPGFLPVTVRGACSSLPCAIGALAPGELREVIATLSPPADYAGPPTVIVRALAVSAPFDPRPENNAASVVTTVTQLADLSITKTGPTTAVPGEQVTYAVTVANAGPSVATGVTVDDPTPAGLTLVSTSGDCTTAFPCDLGTMAPGTTRTIAATYTVAGGTAAPPEITNAATVLSGISDPNPANNSATISTRIRIRAKCDVDGDGVDEIVTGAGPPVRRPARCVVPSRSRAAARVDASLASFLCLRPRTFRRAVSFVACGDVTGDGHRGSHHRARERAAGRTCACSVSTARHVTELASFYAYDPAFTGRRQCGGGRHDGRRRRRHHHGRRAGRRPARARVRASPAGPSRSSPASSPTTLRSRAGSSSPAAMSTGDGIAEIITGAGPGGGPHVRVFDLNAGTSPSSPASTPTTPPSAVASTSHPLLHRVARGGNGHGLGVREAVS